MNYCFIITSCVYPANKELSYSKTRSVFTPMERLQQTINTVNSIKTHCPSAYIILVDNGIKEPADLRKYVDEYYFLGNRRWVRFISSTKNKSLGEWILLAFVTSKCKLDYSIIFKISGRYYLDSNFEISNYSYKYFNFKYIAGDKEMIGIHSAVKGVHTTRLYAFPGIRLREYRYALFVALPRIVLRGMSMEASIARGIKTPIHYMKTLGVTGNVAVDNTYHQE